MPQSFELDGFTGPAQPAGQVRRKGFAIDFKAGRADAEYSARLLGTVDPLSVKHTVPDQDAAERTHLREVLAYARWRTMDAPAWKELDEFLFARAMER